MGDILSQAEIDALLNAMAGGEMEVEAPAQKEKNVRKYDFARPSKFSKDHLRTLENLFDSYARLVTTYLTGYLRTTITIDVLNAEQITYSEFSNSLSNPVIFGVMDWNPLKGSSVVEVSASIGYAIIDRILGGPGDSLRKLRDFSEIEVVLIQRIVVRLMGFLTEPWASIAQIKPNLTTFETNSQFSSIMSPSEMCALITLNVNIGNVEGFIHFCLPHFVLKPVINKLNTKFWYSTVEEEDKDAYREDVERKLEVTKIPVRGLLGRTTITVEDFISLQVGDYITLDSFVDSDLDVMVGNLLKFKARPGIKKKNNAVQITSVIREDE